MSPLSGVSPLRGVCYVMSNYVIDACGMPLRSGVAFGFTQQLKTSACSAEVWPGLVSVCMVKQPWVTIVRYKPAMFAHPDKS